jgi:hypothetical protein
MAPLAIRREEWPVAIVSWSAGSYAASDPTGTT